MNLVFVIRFTRNKGFQATLSTSYFTKLRARKDTISVTDYSLHKISKYEIVTMNS